MNLLTFEEALQETDGRDYRSLLLGNGFSMDQTDGDFSYANLLEKSGIKEGDSIHNLFNTLETADFEEVINALDHASYVAKAYGKKDDSDKYLADADAAREKLIEAIRAVHPSDFGAIDPSEVKACTKFLKKFKTIFTLNYDLLSYWISLESENFHDGFGLGHQRDDGFIGPFKKNAYCSIYNIHGGLHLFLTDTMDIEKKTSEGKYLLSSIGETIEKEKRLPLYVAEGTWKKKLKKIRSVPYLHHCYQKLSFCSGTLFSFGHSASEKDRHIYDAIFSETSEVSTFYYCVYDSNEDEKKHQEIQEFFSRFKERKNAKKKNFKIKYIDTETMDVWGKNNART